MVLWSITHISARYQKAFVIHWVRLDRFASVEEAYSDGTTRLEALMSRVHDIVPYVNFTSSSNNNYLNYCSFPLIHLVVLVSSFSPRLASGSIKLHTSLFGTSLKKSTMTSEDYQKAVLKAKEHILAGDIFQIVLSQRFERRTFADPFEVYRALRIVNPSPYMTYLQVCLFSLKL